MVYRDARDPTDAKSMPRNSRLSILEKDRMSRIITVYIVTSENIATLWIASGHLIPSFVRFAGLNNALKNKLTTTPGMT